MAEFTEEEIRAVIKALENNEYWLSDGFGWYVGDYVRGKYKPDKSYDYRMRQIAISILSAIKKQGG